MYVYLESSKTDIDPEQAVESSIEPDTQFLCLRDRLVVNYSPLVRYVAGRISGRMAGPLDQEDVVASGLFGLLNTVETYDPERRTKFDSYAFSEIRWSILDELRKVDPLSRRTRMRAHQTERTRDELVQKLERVMNSIKNGLGMRETEIAREPS